jgi:hypothetical protein
MKYILELVELYEHWYYVYFNSLILEVRDGVKL